MSFGFWRGKPPTRFSKYLRRSNESYSGAMEDKTREEKVNELRQQWAEEVYRRKLGEYDRLYDRRSNFLERNDRRLKEIREREDEMLRAHRERMDARI